MATDICCPHEDCQHIRPSGLCDLSVVCLEQSNTEDEGLICNDYDKGEAAQADRETEQNLVL